MTQTDAETISQHLVTVRDGLRELADMFLHVHQNHRNGQPPIYEAISAYIGDIDRRIQGRMPTPEETSTYGQGVATATLYLKRMVELYPTILDGWTPEQPPDSDERQVFALLTCVSEGLALTLSRPEYATA